MAQLIRFGLGVQALVVLASQSNQWSSAEIAERIHCEPTALRKILSQLAEAGIIEVRQGRTGGYRLIKHPEEITLARVYRSVFAEDPQWHQMLVTMDQNLYGDKARDSFRQIVTEVNAQVDYALGAYTIADFIE